MKKNLVFVRAGPSSLHREWPKGDPERNWDVCVNWWGEGTPEPPFEYLWREGGNKIQGFDSFLAEGIVEKYEYVLLLDDDLRFRPGAISRFFEACKAHGLEVSQPALTWSSFFSHPVTLRNASCTVRRVNFVEVMAPCFSRGALRELRHTFSLPSQSTYGIDWAWAAESRNKIPMHVVDSVPMVHTKPVDRNNGALYRMLRARGIDLESEAQTILAMYPGYERDASSELEGSTLAISGHPSFGKAIFRTIEQAKTHLYKVQSMRLRWRGLRLLGLRGALRRVLTRPAEAR